MGDMRMVAVGLRRQSLCSPRRTSSGEDLVTSAGCRAMPGEVGALNTEAAIEGLGDAATAKPLSK